MALHESLARSLNLATVNLGMQVGLKPVISTLRALGVERDIDAFRHLLLGALSLSPFEVSQVYRVWRPAAFIRRCVPSCGPRHADQQPLQRYPLTVTQAATRRRCFC